MTLQEAKSIARHLGLTLRQVRSGAYRVNFRDGNETTAYYTDHLEDAVKTAVEMARHPRRITMLKTLIIAILLLPRLTIAQQSQQYHSPAVRWRAAATRRSVAEKEREMNGSTIGNLILMTLICIVIFWVFMA